MAERLRGLERDPVIDAYRAGADLTLIEENLRLTVEQRFDKWMELQRFAEELRRTARPRVKARLTAAGSRP